MTGIFTYIWLISMVNVGKYNSHMDPMGYFMYTIYYVTPRKWTRRWNPACLHSLYIECIIMYIYPPPPKMNKWHLKRNHFKRKCHSNRQFSGSPKFNCCKMQYSNCCISTCNVIENLSPKQTTDLRQSSPWQTSAKARPLKGWGKKVIDPSRRNDEKRNH